MSLSFGRHRRSQANRRNLPEYRRLRLEPLEERQVLSVTTSLDPTPLLAPADPPAASLALEPPRVEGVYVRGTDWSNSFTNNLAACGLGDAKLGYRASNGANQTKPLPWQNINQVSVVFNQDVAIDPGHAQLFGASVANYATKFEYSGVTWTATWTLLAPIAADRLLLQLNGAAGGVTSVASGMLLDGEWKDGTSIYSGNGTAGGNLAFRFNVLPGDASGNGSVQANDVVLLRNAQSCMPGHMSYFCTYDVNGSGAVTSADLVLTRNRQGISLPTGAIYSVADAADLVRKINVTSVAGDTIVIPPGLYDVRSIATLSPKAGVTIRGAGMGLTTVWGKWFSWLGTAKTPVEIEQLSLNTAGLSDTYYIIRFDGGMVNFNHVEMYGPPLDVTVCGFTAISAPGTWRLKDCVFHDAVDGCDLVATLGSNGAANSLKSSLTVEDCEGYHNGRGVSDQFVSGHGDIPCYIIGGTYHDPLGASAFAPGTGTTNGYTRMEMQSVRILSSTTIGAACDKIALMDGCYIEGPSVSCSYLVGAIRGSVITNNHIVTKASFSWGAIQCGLAAAGGATVTIANNWVERHASGNAFYCYSPAGNFMTVNYYNNRVSGNYAGYAFVVDRLGSPTILFRNNIVDAGTTGTIKLSGSGGTVSGDHNVLPGTTVGYVLAPTDINTEPMLEADGTPTLGGNCDGTGSIDGILALWDLFGNPRTRMGTICRGPVERRS